MKLSTLSILFVLALAITGCKSGAADTASAAPDSKSSTATASTDSTPKADAGAAATAAPATDAPKAADSTKTADATPAAGGEKGDLIGKWVDPTSTLPAVIEFKSDGSLAMTIDQNKMSVELDGTYKLDGNKLTSHSTGGKVTADAGADAATQKKAQEANAEIGKQKSPDEVGTIAWKDKNTLLVTSKDGKTTTMTRKS